MNRTGALAIGACAGLIAVFAAASPAAASGLVGTAKSSTGLYVRQGGGTGFASVASMPYNAQGSVSCYIVGQSVDGDAYWDYIDYDGSAGYVADYWLYTGGNVNEQVTRCASLPGKVTTTGLLVLTSACSAGCSQIGGPLQAGQLLPAYCYVVSGGYTYDQVFYDGQFGYVNDAELYTGAAVDTQLSVC